MPGEDRSLRGKGGRLAGSTPRPAVAPTPSSVPPAGQRGPRQPERTDTLSAADVFRLINKQAPEFPLEARLAVSGEISAAPVSDAHQQYLETCRAEGRQLVTVDTSVCISCQRPGAVTLAKEDWERGSAARACGEMIHRAFPMLDADTREQLMTGMHPDGCFRAASGG